jgi:hypothetical protein
MLRKLVNMLVQPHFVVAVKEFIIIGQRHLLITVQTVIGMAYYDLKKAQVRGLLQKECGTVLCATWI